MSREMPRDSKNALPHTFEAARVVRIPLALVLRVLRIRAKWPCAPRKCLPFRNHRLWSVALLHPIHNRGQHIEIIESGRTPCAVVHAGNEEEAAPILNLIEAAIIFGHALVVSERIERRKNGIARTVIEDQLAAVL